MRGGARLAEAACGGLVKLAGAAREVHADLLRLITLLLPGKLLFGFYGLNVNQGTAGEDFPGVTFGNGRFLQ